MLDKRFLIFYCYLQGKLTVNNIIQDAVLGKAVRLTLGQLHHKLRVNLQYHLGHLTLTSYQDLYRIA